MTSPNRDSVSSASVSTSNSLEEVFTGNFALSSTFLKALQVLLILAFSFSDPKYDHIDGSGQTIVIIDSGLDRIIRPLVLMRMGMGYPIELFTAKALFQAKLSIIWGTDLTIMGHM